MANILYITISALATLGAAIISTYGFFAYKRFVKSHKLRIALHSEIAGLLSQSYMVKQDLNSSNKVDSLQINRNKTQIYEEKRGNLDLLTDLEINRVVHAYYGYYMKNQFHQLNQEDEKEDNFKEDLKNELDFLPEENKDAFVEDIVSEAKIDVEKKKYLEDTFQSIALRTLLTMEKTVNKLEDTKRWKIYSYLSTQTVGAEKLTKDKTRFLTSFERNGNEYGPSKSELKEKTVENVVDTIEKHYDEVNSEEIENFLRQSLEDE